MRTPKKKEFLVAETWDPGQTRRCSIRPWVGKRSCEISTRALTSFIELR